jgi:hypothetical protein
MRSQGTSVVPVGVTPIAMTATSPFSQTSVARVASSLQSGPDVNQELAGNHRKQGNSRTRTPTATDAFHHDPLERHMFAMTINALTYAMNIGATK